jgi:hypothetical protein
LKLEPNLNEENWELVLYSDSDCRRQELNQCHWIHHLIFWVSNVLEVKRSEGVTLSSIQAEYVAMSESVKEVHFIFYLIRDMGIPVKLPFMVRADKIDAIFMTNNASSGVRTRHIDTRYHFIRQNVEVGFIKILLVKIDKNVSYLFTNNVNNDTYERRVLKLLDGCIGVIGRVLECNHCIQPFW